LNHMNANVPRMEQALTAFSANSLRRRYLVALSLIAMLTMVSQAVIQHSITSMGYDSRVVNIAGRQRMLSQRIAKTSLYLVFDSDPNQRHIHLGQLNDTLALWQRSHIGLQRGSTELGLPGRNSDEVTKLFAEIEPRYDAIGTAAHAILATAADRVVLAESAGRISQNEADFLRGMDAIVFRYDAEAKARVVFTERLEILLALTTLAVLLLEAKLIFAPAVKSLRQHLHERARHEADLKTLFAASPTAMMLVDPETLAILASNGKAEAILGNAAERIAQQPITDLFDESVDINRGFLELLRSQGAIDEMEVQLTDAKHTLVYALASARPITFSGRCLIALGITNISELKKVQQALYFYATFDEMTGLINRRAGLYSLEKEIARSKRDGIPLAICFADLNGLKDTNDRHGHHEGDWMIRTAARVFCESIREGDVAVRLGGDEFLLILHACSQEQGDEFLERIRRQMTAVSLAEEKHFPFAASLGLAFYDPERHTTVDDLVTEADGKMYEEKKRGRARYQRSAD